MRRLFDDDSVVNDFKSVVFTDTPYQIKVHERKVYVDSTAGAISVYLPDVVEAKGRVYTIEVPYGEAQDTVTIDSKGATNDSRGWPAAGIPCDMDNDYMVFYSDGDRWCVIDGTKSVIEVEDLHVEGQLEVEETIFTITEVAEPTTGGARTVTAANLLGGIISFDPGGDNDLTLPTATLLVAAISNCVVGTTFRCLVYNNGTGAAAETMGIVAGAGGTIKGTVGSIDLTEDTNEVLELIIRITSITGGAAETYDCYILNSV